MSVKNITSNNYEVNVIPYIDKKKIKSMRLYLDERNLFEPMSHKKTSDRDPAQFPKKL